MIVFQNATLNCLSFKILTQNLIISLIGELSKCKTSKMQKLKCPTFEISTQNLLLSVSYCLQHTMKPSHNCCSEIISCSRCLVPVPGSYHRTALFQQTTSSTKNAFAGCWWRSNAEDSASQREHLRQYCTVVSQEVICPHLCWLSYWRIRKFTALWDVTLQYFIGL